MVWAKLGAAGYGGLDLHPRIFPQRPKSQLLSFSFLPLLTSQLLTSCPLTTFSTSYGVHSHCPKALPFLFLFANLSCSAHCIFHACHLDSLTKISIGHKTLVIICHCRTTSLVRKLLQEELGTPAHLVFIMQPLQCPCKRPPTPSRLLPKTM